MNAKFKHWSENVVSLMQLPFPGRTDYSLYAGGFAACFERGDSPADAVLQLIAAVRECEPSPMGDSLESGRIASDDQE